eukprot:CAMPEP_0183706906 /NCGR_PEP_ID=MMETSP0737-20130205/3625_1 /TAXON_ID=385413 /ORGANISM="Thalassiosira miniscula, Strain CCMP1093" /LENGTH=62 /DNA_ID=CAMNT_0025934443 /DNA_START=199 /DNA_END=384 /DNA_ORIENTATION=-
MGNGNPALLLVGTRQNILAALCSLNDKSNNNSKSNNSSNTSSSSIRSHLSLVILGHVDAGKS